MTIDPNILDEVNAVNTEKIKKAIMIILAATAVGVIGYLTIDALLFLKNKKQEGEKVEEVEEETNTVPGSLQLQDERTMNDNLPYILSKSRGVGESSLVRPSRIFDTPSLISRELREGRYKHLPVETLWWLVEDEMLLDNNGDPLEKENREEYETLMAVLDDWITMRTPNLDEIAVTDIFETAFILNPNRNIIYEVNRTFGEFEDMEHVLDTIRRYDKEVVLTGFSEFNQEEDTNKRNTRMPHGDIPADEIASDDGIPGGADEKIKPERKKRTKQTS